MGIHYRCNVEFPPISPIKKSSAICMLVAPPGRIQFLLEIRLSGVLVWSGVFLVGLCLSFSFDCWFHFIMFESSDVTAAIDCPACWGTFVKLGRNCSFSRHWVSEEGISQYRETKLFRGVNSVERLSDYYLHGCFLTRLSSTRLTSVRNVSKESGLWLSFDLYVFNCLIVFLNASFNVVREIGRYSLNVAWFS